MMRVGMIREIHLPKASRYTEIAHGMGQDRWKWVIEEDVANLKLKTDQF